MKYIASIWPTNRECSIGLNNPTNSRFAMSALRRTCFRFLVIFVTNSETIETWMTKLKAVQMNTATSGLKNVTSGYHINRFNGEAIYPRIPR